MSNPNALKAKFGYMFAGDNIGISISKGWFHIFEKLCVDIDEALGEDKRGFHWTQVKEKFGSARFYSALGKTSTSTRLDIMSPAGVDSYDVSPTLKSGDTRSMVFQKINQLVQAAEKETTTTCIVCGQPGEIDRNGGYWLTVCEMHQKQRREKGKKMDSPWFEGEGILNA